MLYFKEYGADLIKLGKKNKIITPFDRNPEFHKTIQYLEEQIANKNNTTKIYNGFKLKKYPLHHDNNKFYITPSELKCLNLLAQGFSTKETANTLQLSPRTVETHVQNMKNKIGLFSSNELLKLYRASHLKNL